MKRLCLPLAGLLLLCFAATGCTSNAGQNFAEILAEQQDVVNAVVSEPEPSEITTYENGNFGPELGFNVTSYPNDANISATHFFVIDKWFGQIQFVTADELHLVLRVAKEDAGFLTTTYTELHDLSDDTRTVNGTEVRTRNSTVGCSMVTWNQGNYQLLLHSNASQGEPPQAVVDQIVAGTRIQAA